MFIKIKHNDKLFENLKSILPDIAEGFDVIPLSDGFLILCKGSKCADNTFDPTAHIRYKNSNRHDECHIQSKEIIGIINDHM